MRVQFYSVYQKGVGCGPGNWVLKVVLLLHTKENLYAEWKFYKPQTAPYSITLPFRPDSHSSPDSSALPPLWVIWAVIHDSV